MSSIYKTGIVSSNEFDESDAMDLITYRNPTTGYTPVKDLINSTFYPAQIVFDYTATSTTASTIYRIIANVSWSGFDTSSTAGTFNIYWQGSNRKISGPTWAWEGTNYISSALNSQYHPKNLVLSDTSGSYIYDTTFTLPDSWRSIYDGSNIGFRTDYSNGVGKITVNDIRIILDKYSSSSNVKLHLGNDYIAGKEFIEVY